MQFSKLRLLTSVMLVIAVSLALSSFYDPLTEPVYATIQSSTVANDVDVYSLTYASSQKIFYANGLYWAFHLDGSNNIQAKSSSDDGATWSSPTLIRADEPTPSPEMGNIGLWSNGTSIEYAYGGCVYADGERPVNYRRGALNSNGTISWLAAEQTLFMNIDACAPSITDDSNGYPVIVFGYSVPTRVEQCY